MNNYKYVFKECLFSKDMKIKVYKLKNDIKHDGFEKRIQKGGYYLEATVYLDTKTGHIYSCGYYYHWNLAEDIREAWLKYNGK